MFQRNQKDNMSTINIHILLHPIRTFQFTVHLLCLQHITYSICLCLSLKDVGSDSSKEMEGERERWRKEESETDGIKGSRPSVMTWGCIVVFTFAAYHTLSLHLLVFTVQLQLCTKSRKDNSKQVWEDVQKVGRETWWKGSTLRTKYLHFNRQLDSVLLASIAMGWGCGGTVGPKKGRVGGE